MSQAHETTFLRLFPLQSVVLFPGMELPLVVFEPRYRQLTQECLEANEPFGVLLLKEGAEVGDPTADPFEVGTTAQIMEASPDGHGRIRVVAVGGQRFKAHSFSRDFPYLSAQVEYLEDDSAAMADPLLITNVREDAAKFVRALHAARGGYVRDVNLPEDPTILSFLVAQMFQGNAGVQQRLLEAQTFDRLWDELNLLKRAMDRLRDFEGRGPSQPFSAN